MLSIPLPVPMMPIRITRFERPDAIGPKAEIPVFGSAHSSPSPKTSFGSSMKKLGNVVGAPRTQQFHWVVAKTVQTS
jgi:hypothetical protein